MPEQHLLNVAVVEQIRHDLCNGQACRVKSMGFHDEDLAMLREPAVASALAHATVGWCRVTVNRSAMRCLLYFQGGKPQTSLEPGRQAHPLNRTVTVQVLHDLHSGQLRRAKAMGFCDEDLEAFKHPAVTRMLMNAGICWNSVVIIREIVLRLMRKAEHDVKEIAEIDRLLRLKVTTGLVGKFYGLVHEETALRRRVTGLPQSKGRRNTLTEEQSVDLWHRYTERINVCDIDFCDERALLNIAADFAEEMKLPLSEIWRAICEWANKGNARNQLP
jgi:hypothetical protein